MSEVIEYDLSDWDRKKIENARTAMNRGIFEYTIEICCSLLEEKPRCLEVRGLLLKRRGEYMQTKAKVWVLCLLV